jgi:hypothetical protein
LAAGDLPRSLEHLSSLLSLSGDNRLKHDLLLKAVELTRHCAPSLAVVAPAHAGPLLKCLRLLLVDKEPTLRSQALRVLRYLLTDWHMLSHMLRLNMDLLVVRSLERDSKFLWERMQALKFVRKWMHMLAQSQAAVKNGKPASTSLSAPNGGVTLPPHQPLELTRSLVQSLVAIAEQPKDDFRRVCLDAIRELSQTDTHARLFSSLRSPIICATIILTRGCCCWFVFLFVQPFCLPVWLPPATASAPWSTRFWTPRAWTSPPV